MIMSHGDGQGCAKDVNAAVAIFNKNLKDLVNDFNKKVKGAKFTYVDIFSGGDPLAFGRLGKLSRLITCLSNIYIHKYKNN